MNTNRKVSGWSVSISPSDELLSEIARQKDAGIWDSRSEFFETAGWLLIEMQHMGADATAAVDDEPRPETMNGGPSMTLTVEHEPDTDSDSDSESDSEEGSTE